MHIGPLLYAGRTREPVGLGSIRVWPGEVIRKQKGKDRQAGNVVNTMR